jgi:hypothetical protein
VGPAKKLLYKRGSTINSFNRNLGDFFIFFIFKTYYVIIIILCILGVRLRNGKEDDEGAAGLCESASALLVALYQAERQQSINRE